MYDLGRGLKSREAERREHPRVPGGSSTSWQLGQRALDPQEGCRVVRKQARAVYDVQRGLKRRNRAEPACSHFFNKFG